MKEIQNILHLFENVDSDESCAMATVVYVEGSSYRRPGARMLITADGRWEGGISGGCLEGDALKKAQNVIHTGKPRIVTYDNREEDPFQIGVSLGCKGLISILLEPISSSSEIIKILKGILVSRKPTVIAHVINQSEDADLGQRIVLSNSEIIFTDLKENLITDLKPILNNSIIKKQGNRIKLNNAVITLEYIRPNNRILIIGGSYDAYPMMRCANELGWQVQMMANENKMRKEAFDICSKTWHEKSADNSSVINELDNYSAVLLLNHDIDRDSKWLQVVLKSDAFYIGLLGPRIRAVELLESLSIDAQQHPRLHYPIGVDIGAQGPEEIALSVLSEIIAVQNSRQAGFLKLRTTPIYDNPR